MKPVDQTLFEPTNGNCFQACVASILECSLDNIPNFCWLSGKIEGTNNYSLHWIDHFNAWLQQHGYFAVECQLCRDRVISCLTTKAYCILTGKSPRGCLHSVVGQVCDQYVDGFQLIHDPHPSREFFGENNAVESVMFIGPTLVELDNYKSLIQRVLLGLYSLPIADSAEYPLNSTLARRVMYLFGVGMTQASNLCHKYQLDPYHRNTAHRMKLRKTI